jgi:serine/threonine-protein kinase HipA
MTTAEVRLWGRTIGAVTWDAPRSVGVFQYAPEFHGSGIQLSPLVMPLAESIYEFPNLSKETFKGLPGLVADSLPDRFGNALIDTWLQTQGRDLNFFSPVERLCYVGTRGMGALEYEPALAPSPSASQKLEIDNLVRLSNIILSQRGDLVGVLNGREDHEALENILRVGTSAGGARAKAILAWNPASNEFRSGQLNMMPGFEPWILKFDGVSDDRSQELSNPQGYGKIEYAYHLMALNAGVQMMPCRLHHEGGRSHFMTKRFDRTETNKKLHMQSLGALVHADFNAAGTYSYEQTLTAMKRMGLPRADLEQQILRAFFNIIARNQDDHVKNIAFLMTPDGNWRLAPAFDVSYAFSSGSGWTSQHQMSLNLKRDQFELEDLKTFASFGGVKPNKSKEMVKRVLEAVRKWEEYASMAGVDTERIVKIHNLHRLGLMQ